MIKANSLSYRNIKSEHGKRSYDFAKKFIKVSGIEARLNTSADACINDENPVVSFNLHSGNYSGKMRFLAEGEQAQIQYSHDLSHSSEEVIHKSDLYSTLKKITKNIGYDFGYFLMEKGKPAGISATERVPTNNYKDFAECVGIVNKIISLYLGSNSD